jgi:hypothetical protein
MIKKNLKLSPFPVCTPEALKEANSAIMARRESVKRCLFERYNEDSD